MQSGSEQQIPSSSAGGLSVSMSTSFRNRRSFRRSAYKPDSESASLSAALLDSQPQRSSSTRQKKKAISWSMIISNSAYTRLRALSACFDVMPSRCSYQCTSLYPLQLVFCIQRRPIKLPGFPNWRLSITFPYMGPHILPVASLVAGSCFDLQTSFLFTYP